MLAPDLYANTAALAALAKLNPTAPGGAAAATSSSAPGGRKDGARTIVSSGGKVTGAERIGGTFTSEADPAWLASRDAYLDEVKKRSEAALKALDKPPIVITLPDGKTQEGHRVCDVTARRRHRNLKGFGAGVLHFERALLEAAQGRRGGHGRDGAQSRWR